MFVSTVVALFSEDSQCLACTALGEQTALAMPDLSLLAPTSKWGIDLSETTPSGR